MPPIYTTAEINARLTVVQNTIDAGGLSGFCNIFDGGNNLLARLTMRGPPCGSIASGVLTFTTPWTAPAATATGVPASATITDSNGATAISGLVVGTFPSSNFDIVFNEPQLTLGKTVMVTFASIVGH